MTSTSGVVVRALRTMWRLMIGGVPARQRSQSPNGLLLIRSSKVAILRTGAGSMRGCSSTPRCSITPQTRNEIAIHRVVAHGRTKKLGPGLGVMDGVGNKAIKIDDAIIAYAEKDFEVYIVR